jgi:hypothetical protein
MGSGGLAEAGQDERRALRLSSKAVKPSSGRKTSTVRFVSVSSAVPPAPSGT